MHILTLVAAGLVLLGLFWAFTRLTGRAFRGLLPAFLATWFVASAVNLWIGVAHAGYTVLEEALVFLPVFGVPAFAAFALARRN